MSTFKSQIISHVNIIQCPQALDRVSMADFPKLTTEWIAADAKLHVMDFRDVVSISKLAFRSIVQFKQDLANIKARLFSIHMSQQVFDQVKAEGMEGVLAPVSSVKEALEKSGLLVDPNKPPAAPTPSISVDFLAPFISAVLGTIIKMAGTTVNAGQPKPIENKKDIKIDIGSTIVVSNEDIQGRVGLYFSEDVFKSLYVKITKDQKFELSSKHSLDLVRELLNIAFGRAKTDWNKLGYSFKRDVIPDSFVGEKLEVHKKDKIANEAVLSFETADGSFYMGISMSKLGTMNNLSFQG